MTQYKVLAAKQYSIFWGAHGKRKPAGFFTESFKDLINKMLALKPEDRLNIEGIKNHEWYKGDVLLLNDLHDDFVQRKKTIDAKKEQEKKANSGGSRAV